MRSDLALETPTRARLLIALLALVAVLLGGALASHAEDAAGHHPAVPVALDGEVAVDDGAAGTLVACSIAVLCCLALLGARARAARDAAPTPTVPGALAAAPAPPAPPRSRPTPLLLSISRT